MGATLTRNVSAGLTGVSTALLGSLVPIVGLAGGIVLQLLEPEHSELRRVEDVTEGAVDGSAALLARALLLGLGPQVAGPNGRAAARGTVVRALASGWKEPGDSDALIG